MSQLASLLWSLAGLIFAITFAIYLWRRPDASFRLRHKDSEIEVKPPPQQTPSPAEQLTAPPAAREADDVATGLPDAAFGADHEIETRFQRAYKLLNSGEYEEGIKLMKEEAHTKADLAGQASLIAFGQHLAAVKGSTVALDDLKRTARENREVSNTHFWLGVTLRDLGLKEEADAAFLECYNSATTDDRRATALLARTGDYTRNLEETIRVVDELLESARALEEHLALSRVYAFAADLMLKAEPPDLVRSFALYELAVQLAPANNSVRFDLAYAYSEHEAPAAALLQYKILLERDPENPGAMNNMGAAAARLNLDSVAVDYYKRAEVLGNTLATANLAWKLINAGFLDEARERLESKVGVAGVHRDVLSALGGVARQESDDEGKSRGVLRAAEKTRALRIRIGRGLASGVKVGPEAAGTYSDGPATLELTTSTTGLVTGALKTEGEIWDFSGSFVGDALLAHWHKRKPKSEVGWSVSNILGNIRRGQGVFVLEGDTLEGISYEGKSQVDPSTGEGLKEWHFRRR